MPAVSTPPPSSFSYDRIVLGFHGTRRNTANALVKGEVFRGSRNRDDWLGHGVYFWEYAPRQAWWWAERRYGADAAVVGAMVRLGRCLDLLDPANLDVVGTAHDDLKTEMAARGVGMPRNGHTHKYLDCAVFNWLFGNLEDEGIAVETCRAVFVPGVSRVWPYSGIFNGGHIQLCVREPLNISAVWRVRRDGRYGED